VEDLEAKLTNFTNNEMKLEVLSSLQALTSSVKAKVIVLDALDRDNESGAYDLHDQLTTLWELTEKLQAVVLRCVSIVPGGEDS